MQVSSGINLFVRGGRSTLACLATVQQCADARKELWRDRPTDAVAMPSCSALREVGLNFYDHRAVVVEVVARLDGLRAAATRREPLYAQQLMALEALQVYAPMGHALGLDAVSAELEDCCFQVPCCACFARRLWVPFTAASGCGRLPNTTACEASPAANRMLISTRSLVASARPSVSA